MRKTRLIIFGVTISQIHLDGELKRRYYNAFFASKEVENRFITPLDVVPEQGKVCVAGVVGLGSDIPYLGEGGDILKIRG
jgi:hypothetical protein